MVVVAKCSRVKLGAASGDFAQEPTYTGRFDKPITQIVPRQYIDRCINVQF